MTGTVERRTFSISRAADFLDVRALVSQTGQRPDRFGAVVVKELLDNALDACETARVAPDVEIAVAADGDVQLVTVADNGAGIPPDVVGRVLDFTTLTSDKALYRSPSRGAQGNALKTILGIPHALGVAAPVVVEARGVRHEITVSLDLAGNLSISHDRQESSRRDGTAVTVPLPHGLAVNAAGWVRGYAFVNPHASFRVVEHADSCEPETPDSYKATAGDGWRKPLPGDSTSAHWYDAAAFTRLAGSLAELGDDRPLGAFAAEFAGLSGSGKRKQIAAAVPHVRRVADLAADPGAAAHLLAAMKAASSEPKFTVLGQVPEGHYRELLDRLYGVERFWYRHGGIVHQGIPWHVEVAVAETARPGEAVYGCNYGVSFGDPLGGVWLGTADVGAPGARGFLSACDAAPGPENDHRRAAVVHVTCAAPVFTDKGKTHLTVPAAVAEAFASVLWRAAKDLHREAKAAERAARSAINAAERERKAAEWEPSVKAAVSWVIGDAVAAVQGGTTLPFSARALFYKVRPLIQRFTSKDLDYGYFAGTLLPEYQRLHGQLRGLYYEPRGELHHPHDPDGRQTVPLGTREVSVYKPPEWTFDKILVVEKAGLWPVLNAGRLADRYDMAVITSEGFAVEAARSLLASMPPGDVRIFALHDADPHGYNIARTLGEATRRMPDHHVEVTDLGLTVEDAIARGMEPETFTRSAALPRRIGPHLTAAAREWFTGTVSGWDRIGNPSRWRCRRVELNAFSSPGLIAYIEEGLAGAGASGKLIPPADVIERHAREQHRELIADRVERLVAELLDTDAITESLTGDTAAALDFAIEPADVAAQLAARRERSWRTAVRDEIEDRLDDLSIDLRGRLAEWITGQIREDNQP